MLQMATVLSLGDGWWVGDRGQRGRRAGLGGGRARPGTREGRGRAPKFIVVLCLEPRVMVSRTPTNTSQRNATWPCFLIPHSPRIESLVTCPFDSLFLPWTRLLPLTPTLPPTPGPTSFSTAMAPPSTASTQTASTHPSTPSTVSSTTRRRQRLTSISPNKRATRAMSPFPSSPSPQSTVCPGAPSSRPFCSHMHRSPPRVKRRQWHQRRRLHARHRLSFTRNHPRRRPPGLVQRRVHRPHLARRPAPPRPGRRRPAPARKARKNLLRRRPSFVYTCKPSLSLCARKGVLIVPRARLRCLSKVRHPTSSVRRPLQRRYSRAPTSRQPRFPRHGPMALLQFHYP